MNDPVMPSPARAADRSIVLAVRLGVSKRDAPGLIVQVCAGTAIRLSAHGCTDLTWIRQVQARALARMYCEGDSNANG